MGCGASDLNNFIELVDRKVGGDAPAVDVANEIANAIVSVSRGHGNGGWIGPRVAAWIKCGIDNYLVKIAERTSPEAGRQVPSISVWIVFRVVHVVREVPFGIASMRDLSVLIVGIEIDDGLGRSSFQNGLVGAGQQGHCRARELDRIPMNLVCAVSVDVSQVHGNGSEAGLNYRRVNSDLGSQAGDVLAFLIIERMHGAVTGC